MSRVLAVLIGITIGNHIRAARSRRLVDIGYHDGFNTGRILHGGAALDEATFATYAAARGHHIARTTAGRLKEPS